MKRQPRRRQTKKKKRLMANANSFPTVETIVSPIENGLEHFLVLSSFHSPFLHYHLSTHNDTFCYFHSIKILIRAAQRVFHLIAPNNQPAFS